MYLWYSGFVLLGRSGRCHDSHYSISATIGTQSDCTDGRPPLLLLRSFRR